MITQWRGKPGAPGVAVARARVLTRLDPAHEPLLGRRAVADPDIEIARLRQALARARVELAALAEQARSSVNGSTAEIFDAHAMILDDPEWTEPVETRIRADRVNAEYAYRERGLEIAASLAALEDPYLRERAIDVHDVLERVLRGLLELDRDDQLTPQAPTGEVNTPHLPPWILVAEDLTPSDTLRLPREQIAGLVTDRGGKTSHTAILARALGIPAVLGAQSAAAGIRTGDWLAIDGDTGQVVARPSEELKIEFQRRATAQAQAREQLERFRGRPSQLSDGTEVTLAANVGASEDALLIERGDAEGVGLYRTEFLFLDRTQAPSEDDQYAAYRQMVEACRGRLCVIRTLDVGGDKAIPYLPFEREDNPFLGNRAIRFCLERPDFFRTQLRAIWRAAVHGPVGVMFPMVSRREEIIALRTELDAARVSLGKSLPTSGMIEIQVGIMIEIPSAALMAAEWAPLVDFMSIGTNDLTQYTLAVDRMNPAVADLYDPYHPAVWRLMDLVCRGAAQHGKWVGVCGEMAGQPELARALVGLGVRELSMTPSRVLAVRAALAQSSSTELAAVAQQILQAADSSAMRLIVAHEDSVAHAPGGGRRQTTAGAVDR